jgi:HSP20 family protein
MLEDNMFKIFSFEVGDIFNLSNIEKIKTVMNSVLDNNDLDKFKEDFGETFTNEHYKEVEEVHEDNFIQLNQYEDMYLLTIDLKGIDIRELSIRYDPGKIEINLNRLEVQKSFFGIIAKNIIVKKPYNKKFENIEEIDISQILKNIDDGVLSIRMQKKYLLENESSIVEVDSYEDNVYN